MNYYIDPHGQIWKDCGRVGCHHEDCQNLHYAIFEGYMSFPPFAPIWVFRRTYVPDNARAISEAEAIEAMQHVTLPNTH